RPDRQRRGKTDRQGRHAADPRRGGLVAMATSHTNPPGGNAEPRVTPEIAAEAAVWIAMLHGPNRSPKMERGFRSWQAQSAPRRRAFEATTDVWEAVPRVGLADAYASASARSSGKGWRRRGGGDPWRSRRRRWPLLVLLPLMAASVAVLLRFSG